MASGRQLYVQKLVRSLVLSPTFRGPEPPGNPQLGWVWISPQGIRFEFKEPGVWSWQ